MGKVILIKSVCCAILAYFIQCLPLPLGICNDLDKMFRAFLWSSVYREKKLHLVSWDKICRDTKEKGLGIFKTHERNLAFLAKLVWRFQTEHDLTWVKLCVANQNLRSFKIPT